LYPVLRTKSNSLTHSLNKIRLLRICSIVVPAFYPGKMLIVGSLIRATLFYCSLAPLLISKINAAYFYPRFYSTTGSCARIQACMRTRFHSFPRSPYVTSNSIYNRNIRLNISTDTLVSISLSKTKLLPSIYMLLLAFQFAIQPILTKKFAPKGIIRSTYVFAQDCTRLLISAFLLTANQSWNSACNNWTFYGSLFTAGVPSILYLIQSYFSLIAYQSLSPITYNVLNQTKTISAAICCFLLLGQRQSFNQIIALAILLLAALVMENIIPLSFSVDKHDPTNITNLHTDDKSIDPKLIAHPSSPASRFAIESGIVPILLASLLSGLAGAWTQRSLLDNVYGGNSNSLFFTFQLSIYSIIMMATTLLVPGLSLDQELLKSQNDGTRWNVGWTSKTWIPIIVNAIGGILVGLVTKTSGVVPKGFALILGMFLSGQLQNQFSGENVSKQQWIGGLLAALSIWMHTSYPYNAALT
jgi:solute carrier family 35 (UDP-sugar transporter), member A1/2/3